MLQLADHFVEKYSKANQKKIHRISTAAIDLMMRYHWPGNVRELENCIERAVLLCRGDAIQAHHLPPTLQASDQIDKPASCFLDSRAQRPRTRDDRRCAEEHAAAIWPEPPSYSESASGSSGLRVKKYNIDTKRFRPVADR